MRVVWISQPCQATQRKTTKADVHFVGLDLGLRLGLRLGLGLGLGLTLGLGRTSSIALIKSWAGLPLGRAGPRSL